MIIDVDIFLKSAHFISCQETNDEVIQVADLYFKEFVRLHGIPKTIILVQDVKFLSHFWRILKKNMGTKLQFSSASPSQTNGLIEAGNSILGNLL